jgi:flagellar export protein FliJ
MRKFKFNLERLLRIRKHEEQQWEIKLGHSVSDCVLLEADIRHRSSEIERISKIPGGIQGRESDLLSMEMYKRRMNKEIGELNVKLKKAESKRDEVRAQFLEVSKRRKVLTS